MPRHMGPATTTRLLTTRGEQLNDRSCTWNRVFVRCLVGVDAGVGPVERTSLELSSVPRSSRRESRVQLRDLFERRWWHGSARAVARGHCAELDFRGRARLHEPAPY